MPIKGDSMEIYRCRARAWAATSFYDSWCDCACSRTRAWAIRGVLAPARARSNWAGCSLRSGASPACTREGCRTAEGTSRELKAQLKAQRDLIKALVPPGSAAAAWLPADDSTGQQPKGTSEEC